MYERLKDLRKDNGFTQSAIAEMLSVHQTTYSDYELGNLNIPDKTLDFLADLYCTSVDYLLGRTDISTPYPKSILKKDND